MNIYALEGHKVVCSSLTGGYDYHEEVAQKYLEVGKVYTVECTEVGNNITYVWLKEIPNKFFNSIYFEDVTPQSEELDKQHPGYEYFN